MEQKKLRAVIQIFLIFSVCAMIWLGVAKAQSAPAPKPAAMTATPAPVATMAVAVTPTQPAMAVSSGAVTMEASPAASASSQAKTEPVYKSPSFWIGVVGGPLLAVILSILVAFGVIKKSYLQWLKDKQVVQIADKVVSNFLTYAKGTPAKWDDILAEALQAVVARVGALTESEEAKVKEVVANRQQQETAQAAVASDEQEKPQEKTETEKTS